MQQGHVKISRDWVPFWTIFVDLVLAGPPQVKGDNNDVNVKRLPKKPVSCKASQDYSMLHPGLRRSLPAATVAGRPTVQDV